MSELMTFKEFRALLEQKRTIEPATEQDDARSNEKPAPSKQVQA